MTLLHIGNLVVCLDGLQVVPKWKTAYVKGFVYLYKATVINLSHRGEQKTDELSTAFGVYWHLVWGEQSYYVTDNMEFVGDSGYN